MIVYLGLIAAVAYALAFFHWSGNYVRRLVGKGVEQSDARRMAWEYWPTYWMGPSAPSADADYAATMDESPESESDKGFSTKETTSG